MTSIPVRHINEPEPSESFVIRKVEALLSGKDMVQPLHRHDYFFLLILEKGKGEHVIDFTSYTVGDHTVFFLRPGQVHQLTLKKGSTGYLIQFSKGFYPSQKNQIYRRVNNSYKFNRDGFKKVIVVVNFLFQEYRDKQQRYLDAIKASLEILFIKLTRQSEGVKGATTKKLYAQERLEQLLELIETHVANKKQVAQYAALLNVTPYQLNAITKETLGKTCSEVINQHIVLEAKRFLLATSNQVNQIANDLGYDDISYFIRFFKKHTRYTPQAFRENFK